MRFAHSFTACLEVSHAHAFRGDDPNGDRAEFVKLAEVAAGLKNLDGR